LSVKLLIFKDAFAGADAATLYDDVDGDDVTIVRHMNFFPFELCKYKRYFYETSFYRQETDKELDPNSVNEYIPSFCRLMYTIKSKEK
jgi:hypothetical protein